MLALNIFALALVQSTLTLAKAIPSTPGPIKRNSFDEGIYMATCDGPNGRVRTEIDYYKAADTSQSKGVFPDSTANLGAGARQWEGNTFKAYFADTGTEFWWNFQSGATTRPFGTLIGTAWNSWGSKFDCYYQEKLHLYSKDGFDCTFDFECF